MIESDERATIDYLYERLAKMAKKTTPIPAVVTPTLLTLFPLGHSMRVTNSNRSFAIFEVILGRGDFMTYLELLIQFEKNTKPLYQKSPSNQDNDLPFIPTNVSIERMNSTLYFKDRHIFNKWIHPSDKIICNNHWRLYELYHWLESHPEIYMGIFTVRFVYLGVSATEIAFEFSIGLHSYHSIDSQYATDGVLNSSMTGNNAVLFLADGLHRFK